MSESRPQSSQGRDVVRAQVGWTAALLLVLLAAACGPGANPSGPAPNEGERSQATTPKTLTIGIQREPTDFYGVGSGAGGGVSQVPPIGLDTLVIQNAKGEYLPQLAAEMISLEQGTWRVNPDGTMDTAWKLRPGVKWHDGAPFTAADMVFTATVRKDPESGIRNFGRLDLVQSASAPDPLTFALHWSGPYVDANQALDLEPLPRHLLEDTYRNEKENFTKSPFLMTQFIGQGPYRLAEWQGGSHMVFTRFDEYYQGRPPLDRVVVRFLGDPNTMLANILSGTVDLLLPSGVDFDAAVEVQERWAGTGHTVRFDLIDSFRMVEIQFRPDVARPRDGLATNLAVRQAFYHAVDRMTLAEVVMHGLAPVADSWLPPNSALRPSVGSMIPQFPYDPARAQQLLEGAGWVRGADGVLVNMGTSERFETDLWTNTADGQKQMNVVANHWKQIGAQVSEMVIPPARTSDREYGATYPGALVTTNPASAFTAGRYHSKEVRSAANRWSSQNRAGYANPALDVLLDRATVTINPSERTALMGQLLQAEMGDVVVIPLFWNVLPVLQMKGVKSHETITFPDSITTWNFFEFDKEP